MSLLSGEYLADKYPEDLYLNDGGIYNDDPTVGSYYPQ